MRASFSLREVVSFWRRGGEGEDRRGWRLPFLRLQRAALGPPEDGTGGGVGGIWTRSVLLELALCSASRGNGELTVNSL
jgi:hypothetical protein